MEFYVNNICYANGIYGIAGAAKAYFDKDVDELTLSECVYLCAIPNSPTYYDPYVYPERALERRDKILRDMLEAYSTLANHGDHVDAACIVSMKDSHGDEIYEEPSSREIYTDKAADDMMDILKGVLTNGTASSLRWSRSSDIEAFAKTGTTNDSKDGWFCGATPYYSITVWVGYDTPKTLSDLYGSTYPGSIWKESMLAATEGLEATVFERNNEDASYAEALRGTSYYDYLPSRDDSEVLSSGYTVTDYRTDRVTGERVTEIIQKIKRLQHSDFIQSHNSRCHPLCRSCR